MKIIRRNKKECKFCHYKTVGLQHHTKPPNVQNTKVGRAARKARIHGSRKFQRLTSPVDDYRQDAAKRQTAGIVFTHRPKIRFFAPQGRLVAPIQVNLCRTDGHLGLLGSAKFDVNRPRGWECGPQNIKNFHFLVESPRRGDSLDRFPKFLGAFIRLIILR